MVRTFVQRSTEYHVSSSLLKLNCLPLYVFVALGGKEHVVVPVRRAILRSEIILGEKEMFIQRKFTVPHFAFFDSPHHLLASLYHFRAVMAKTHVARITDSLEIFRGK